MSTKPTVAWIGCWFNRDMYSHNCSALVDSLRNCGVKTTVVTSNCRCFSSAQRFDITPSELINTDCVAVKLPHAPMLNLGKKHGRAKYLAVKLLRLDLWLATVRGFFYYRKSRRAEIIHYDQVLEAFGCIPLYVLAMLSGITQKRLFVTVHEIDPFQKRHRWVNRLYRNCEKVIVFSENMKRAVEAFGVDPAKIRVTRYGSQILDLLHENRSRYIYFGGHNILSGKGYPNLLQALRTLKEKSIAIRLVIYVGHGCNGIREAHEMADRAGLNDIIEWREFFSGAELAAAYQSCKACIVPYTGGSARHTITTAMANATPVIATQCVDIPEYLGTSGIYIDGSPESIVDAVSRVESGAIDLHTIGGELRQKALQELDVNKTADQLVAIYSES